MPDPDPDTFVLTLQALPDDRHPPVPSCIRMRMLLKRALRSWRFRCIEVRGYVHGKPLTFEPEPRSDDDR